MKAFLFKFGTHLIQKFVSKSIYSRLFFYYFEMFCFAVRVGVIYLLSGIGGSILSSLFIQRNISVGASGALFGLLGAMLSELLTNWTIYTNKVICSYILFSFLSSVINRT